MLLLRRLAVAAGLALVVFIIIDTHALPGMHPPAPFVESSERGSVAPGLTAYPVPGGAVFVAPSGSDAASGSKRHPYRTVAHAVARARNGATIELRAGSYAESVRIPAGQALTVQAYPHEVVWFDGGSTLTTAVDVRSAETLLRGFGVRRYAADPGGRGAVTLIGKHSRTANLTITDNAGPAVVVHGPSVRVDHLTAEGNAVGLDAVGANDLRVYNSIVRSSTGDGMHLAQSTDLTLRSTAVLDSGHDGIAVVAVQRLLIIGDAVRRSQGYGLALSSVVESNVLDNRLESNARGLAISGARVLRVWNNDLAQDPVHVVGSDEVDVVNNVLVPTTVTVTSTADQRVRVSSTPVPLSPAVAELLGQPVGSMHVGAYF